jgi:oligopeptide transport system substrate-binding protein
VASDFVAAFERLLSPDLASPFWDSIVDVPGAEEVKRGRKNFGDLKIRALNAHSLELPSSKAYSAKLLMALTQVSLSPYRPGVELGRLSSGLYELVQWTRDQRLILSHRKPVPASAVETIEYLMIRDPSTALRMYESGQLDFLTELPTIELERLKRHPDHVAYDLATTYYVGFGFADTKGALSLELRQALSKVLRQQDIPALLKGDELEAKGWTPENLLPPLARPQKSLSVGSPKVAQRNPLILKYTVGDRHRMLMEYVAHRAKTELGLKLVLEPSDFKVLMAELRTRAPQLFRMAWSAAYPDPLFFLEIFTSSNPNNFGRYKNPRFDALVATMQATPFNKRDARFWKQFREAEHILLVDDPALIPLYHYKGHALLKPKFRAGPFNFQGVPAIAEFGLRP